jgi:hypothetical protein
MRKELKSDKHQGIENLLLPPIVIENKKLSRRKMVKISLVAALAFSILPIIAFGWSFFQIAILWMIMFLVFLICSLPMKDEKTVIGNDFIRKYERTSSKPWTLKSEEPYSSFCEIEFVLYTKDVKAREVMVYLIRNEGKKFHLFTFGELKGANIASYGEAEHLAKSVSHELSIPINMWEDDWKGLW